MNIFIQRNLRIQRFFEHFKINVEHFLIFKISFFSFSNRISIYFFLESISNNSNTHIDTQNTPTQTNTQTHIDKTTHTDTHTDLNTCYTNKMK